jgi:lipopolysaccharide/colanic/teichoic acid biosynthesis glycosyltransferase
MSSYVHPVTRIAKRSTDLITAIGGLIVLSPLLPLIALAIRLDSPGPILFRQLRIGESTPEFTHLFEMIKFRTMRIDAETVSGAVWATEQDPRVTRVGRFLRKSRLDELPQLINVLRGEMSIIGPRPERPGSFQKLGRAIPYYEERVYGVRPGITGLAQVSQGYDRDIEDVRSKLLYDHAYAAALTQPLAWLTMDFQIVFRTITVMVLGRGQ